MYTIHIHVHMYMYLGLVQLPILAHVANMLMQNYLFHFHYLIMKMWGEPGICIILPA